MDGLPADVPTPPCAAAQLIAAIARCGRPRDAEKEADAHLVGLSGDPLALAGFLHREPNPPMDATADAARARIAASLAPAAGPAAPRNWKPPAARRPPGVGSGECQPAGGNAAAPAGVVAFDPSTDDIAQALDHAAVAGAEAATNGGRVILVAVALGVLIGAAAVWAVLV